MTDTPRSHGRKTIRVSATPKDLIDPNPTLAGVWTARIVTLFPDLFPGPLGASLTGRALQEGLWQMHTTDLRSHGIGRHRAVDDTPAGGGAGMVLRPDVVASALAEAAGPGPVIYLSPRGAPFTQARARGLARGPGVTLLCGRFEGVDQRVLDHFGIEEVSMGDYVLTGGEIPAMALIDATVRLLPGVLGNAASTEEESFSHGLLEHPQYTRPAEWEGREIPAVLTSGDHGAVARWRLEQARALTRARRPDLWTRYEADNDPDR